MRTKLLILGCLLVMLCPALIAQSITQEVRTATKPDWVRKGSGTLVDPWIVASSMAIEEIAVATYRRETYEGCYFRLECDIEMSMGAFVGSLNTPFKGCFDGAGYTISVIKQGRFLMDDHFYQTIFGCLGEGAVITNLTVKHSEELSQSAMAYDFAFVGGIAGLVLPGATVRNCIAECNTVITGRDATVAYMGDVVAYNLGTVVNCISRGKFNYLPANSTWLRSGKAVGYNGYLGEHFSVREDGSILITSR